MCAKTTPEVPRVQDTTPSSTMPLPTALEAWSPPPPTTGVPGARPVSPATLAAMQPLTSHDSWHAGRMERSRPKPSIISKDQRRFTTSNIAVPEASETSEANSPVRR